MPGEARESRLTIDAWKDMESELLRALDDDVFASRVPANHVVVLWALEETGRGERGLREKKRERRTRRAL